jgi:hypothetical protein
MSNDDEKGTVCSTFQLYGDRMPLWIWIVWIPQLLTALVRREAAKVRSIMLHLATVYPQALYYTLRAFLLEKREIPPDEAGTGSGAEEKAAGGAADKPAGGAAEAPDKPAADKPAAAPDKPAASTSTPPDSASDASAPKPRQNSVKYAEELVAYLRRAHPALASEVERMLEELIVRFKPQPEEELESAVHALAGKCQQLPVNADAAAVPSSLSQTLTRVCRKFFSRATSSKSERHARFVEAYKEPFQRDLLPVLPVGPLVEPGGSSGSTPPPAVETRPAAPNPSFPSTLAGVTRRLRAWKRFLRRRGRRLPSSTRMSRCSRYLSEFQSHLIEVPGAYLSTGDREPKPKLHAKAHRFAQRVEVLHRHGFSQRRVGIIGSDGRSYHFLVQFAIPHLTRSDERAAQLRAILNRFLHKGVEARRRCLSFAIDAVVPVTPRVRLVRDDPTRVSLEDVYAEWLALGAAGRTGGRRGEAGPAGGRGESPPRGLGSPGARAGPAALDARALDALPRSPTTARPRTPPGLEIRNSLGRNALGGDAALLGPDASDAEPDVDDAVDLFRRLQLKYRAQALADGATPEELSSDAAAKRFKLRAYREVCRGVPAGLLRDRMRRCAASADELWHMRTTMARQVGLSSFLCHLLSIGGIAPHRLLIGLDGSVSMAEARPSYNHNGRSHTGEMVPFRLTRCMQRALGDFHVCGTLAASIGAAALCVQERRDILQDYLALYMRDDLLSWHASKTPARSEAAERRLERQLRERVARNVHTALSHLQMMAPRVDLPASGGAPSAHPGADARRASFAAVRQARLAAQRELSGGVGFESSVPGAVGGRDGGAFGAASALGASKATDKSVFALISTATDEQCVSQMAPTWSSWL